MEAREEGLHHRGRVRQENRTSPSKVDGCISLRPLDPACAQWLKHGTAGTLTAQLFAMNIHEITGHPDRDLEILKCRASSALWWTEKSFTVHT